MTQGIGDSALARLVERQMRNWEISRSQQLREPQPEREEVRDFVCLSRMVGIGDREIAQSIGRRLSWPVFDKEILEAMSGDDTTRRQIYASMDQRDLSWWEQAVIPFLQEDFGRNDYFRRLCETVLSLARQGNAVFVGRGADLLLPKDHGFRVRLVAPRESRVAFWARDRGLDPDAAAREIEQIAKLRREFLRNHFRIEAEDPTRHDLVVNLESFPAEKAVEVILRARSVFRERAVPVAP